MKKKAISWTVSVICFGLLVSYWFVYKPNQDLTHTGASQAPIQGYGISLDRQLDDANYGFIVDTSKEDEFNHSVRFTNQSGKDDSFLLLVFLDYQQIRFAAVNGAAADSYRFEAKSNQELKIPVRFATKGLDPSAHALSFSIIAGPDKHAGQLQKSSEGYGVSIRYNLRVSNETNFTQIHAAEKPTDVLPATSFNGIRINQDAHPTEKAMLPALQINAKPDEKVDLTFLAGGDQDTTDYLAWMTIGYHQSDIEPGRKTWSFQVPTSQFAVKKTQVTAPHEPGDYEVCGFLAPNPWKVLDDGFLNNVEIRTSYRFTLHVE